MTFLVVKNRYFLGQNLGNFRPILFSTFDNGAPAKYVKNCHFLDPFFVTFFDPCLSFLRFRPKNSGAAQLFWHFLGNFRPILFSTFDNGAPAKYVKNCHFLDPFFVTFFDPCLSFLRFRSKNSGAAQLFWRFLGNFRPILFSTFDNGAPAK
jgi:hypothetical protein